MKRMFVTLALATAAVGVFAQPPQNPAPAPTFPATAAPTIKKEKTQISNSLTVFTPLTVLKPVAHKKINRVDGMSSRPWAQVVGWHPGESAFPRPELRDPSMPLFCIGQAPWH